MSKEFLPYVDVRNNAIKLAYKIYQDDFVPDVIYVLLRGGAYIGNVLSEYFKAVRRDARPIFYAAVVARSYTDIREQEKVMIDGWTYSPEHLRHGDKVLLVDDIFDSGRTINYLAAVLNSHGIPRKDLKIAVHDFKIREFQDDTHVVIPDYYCRKLVLNNKHEDKWIHYMSHELIGLTQEELEEHYYKHDTELREALQLIINT